MSNDLELKFPRFGGQCHYAAFFSISSLMNFNSNSIGLTAGADSTDRMI